MGKDTSEFLNCDRDERAKRLVTLAHQLTVAARGTYEAGTDRVVDAVRLRSFNELLHRVLSFIRDELTGGTDRERREGMFELISAGLEEVGCPHLLRALHGLPAAR